MKRAIQCFILLACAAICTSTAMKRCRCIKTNMAVNPRLIVEVNDYKPRPHCNKHQVIVTLKDNSERCLNPDSKFTKELLRRKEMKKAAEMATSSRTTTVAATTSVPASS